MRKFVQYITYFVLAIGLLLILLVHFRADGYTDPFYLRFTSKKQNNLIIGTSRAAQGVLPGVLNKRLNKSFYNYSFTLGHSPFGPAYFNSICKKIDTSTKNGVFIVSVDPWSISSIATDPNDQKQFIENDLCVAKLTYVNMNPNFEYFIKNWHGQMYKSFFCK